VNIGVFGASGSIGRRIVDEALSRGHAVTALARDASRVGTERAGVVWKIADILNVQSIAGVIGDVDVLVSSYGPGPRSDASGNYIAASVAAAINEAGALVVAARSLLKALEQRPSLRLIVVGGAASLEVAPGIQAVDSGPMIMGAIREFGLPPEYKAVMDAHRDAMNLYRLSDRNWSYFCPAIITVPGERTGRFRLGGNQPVMDAEGQSRISYEDFAAALLDEVEIPAHLRQRFTVGY
jgi:uncharacterized protein